MSTLVESLRNRTNLLALSGGGVVLLIVAAIYFPNLMQRPHEMSLQQMQTLDEHRQSDKNATSMARSQTEISASMEPAAPPPSPPGSSDLAFDRKMVRTISLEMTVASPVESAQKIQAFTAEMGGYVESSQLSTQGTPNATLTIRVPAGKLEEVKAGLRKLAVHVDSEKTDAQDVTKQYVDMNARLRNLRAEEAQYLTIMKSAAKVQDMLDVSEKLSSVRGEIEQQQAEFATLSKQVETVAITIALQAQAQADVMGFHWRPLYQLKLAGHDALDGLANYATTMTEVILYLPVILLWCATILFAAFVGWRVLRWVGRVFFGWKPAVAQ
jgi:hypothetical protein